MTEPDMETTEESSRGPIGDWPHFARRPLLKALGVGGTLSLGSGMAAASAQECENEESVQLVRDYTEMWNEQDYSRIPDLVTESFVLNNPSLPEDEVQGHDGLEEWMRLVATGFPDFEVTTVDLFAREDATMSEVIYTMTHEGEFMGIPPTGREVELEAAVKFHIEDGKIQEHRDYFDQLDLLVQLGVAEE